MQRLEVSGAVRPTYGSLGVKRLILAVQIQSALDNYTHKCPVLRNPAAQTNGGDPTVRVLGFSIKCYFPLAGCDPPRTIAAYRQHR